MQQHQQKELQEAKAYAKRLNTIVLSDKKDEDKDKEDMQKPEMVRCKSSTSRCWPNNHACKSSN